MTAAAKHINHLQGRSLAFSNDVGKSLRRTRDYNIINVKEIDNNIIFIIRKNK